MHTPFWPLVTSSSSAHLPFWCSLAADWFTFLRSICRQRWLAVIRRPCAKTPSFARACGQCNGCRSSVGSLDWLFSLYLLVFQLRMTLVPIRLIFEALLLNSFLLGDLLMLHSFTYFCISFWFLVLDANAGSSTESADLQRRVHHSRQDATSDGIWNGRRDDLGSRPRLPCRTSGSLGRKSPRSYMSRWHQFFTSSRHRQWDRRRRWRITQRKQY